VYAIIALTMKDQKVSFQDVMCNLLIRLISAFETKEGAGSKTKRAKDELEDLVNSLKVKEDEDQKSATHSRDITSELLKIFRIECPVNVPQIGRAAFRWGVLSQDLSIIKMAFTAYECLLQPLEDSKSNAKQTKKQSTSKKHSMKKMNSYQWSSHPEFVSLDHQLIGVESRVAVHTLLVKLVQILQDCEDRQRFMEYEVESGRRHACAILDMLLVITRHFASISKLHEHPSLLWTAIGLLRCDLPEVYNYGLKMLAEIESYKYLKSKNSIPQKFWAYAEGWNPRFTGVLLSLIPGMMNPETQAETMALVYQLIRLPCDSFVGLDSSSSTRQIISIMMFLPWLHVSLQADRLEPSSIEQNPELSSILTPSKVLEQLARVVSVKSTELAEIFTEFSGPDPNAKVRSRDRGDLFLKRTCEALVKAYFPTYALPCANYLTAACKSDCKHLHPSVFAVVHQMLTQPNAQTYIMAFQPIIEIVQNEVVQVNDETNYRSDSSKSAQIIRAVMEVLLDEGKRRNTYQSNYKKLDVIPIQNLSNTVEALRKVLLATPQF